MGEVKNLLTAWLKAVLLEVLIPPTQVGETMKISSHGSNTNATQSPQWRSRGTFSYPIYSASLAQRLPSSHKVAPLSSSHTPSTLPYLHISFAPTLAELPLCAFRTTAPALTQQAQQLTHTGSKMPRSAARKAISQLISVASHSAEGAAVELLNATKGTRALSTAVGRQV